MKPLLLCILDGWGISTTDEHNGIKAAKHWPEILKKHPNTTLQASESFVGLPDGQMGNSEVGHMTIGLGRKLVQDLPKISEMIIDGSLMGNNKIEELVDDLIESQKTCHVMGLLSDGGVHAHQSHIESICQHLSEKGIKIVFHALLDGRDTSQKSATKYIKKFQENLPNIEIATIGGRFFAMDRDQRWERIESAYRNICCAESESFNDAISYIEESYKNNITDEFIEPAHSKNYSGMESGDALIVCNFRADRMRQIMRALAVPNFNAFKVCHKIKFSHVVTLGSYASDIDEVSTCIVPKKSLKNSLGEVISNNNLKQLRISETEKYAHVTFFFNGGKEIPLKNEERILVPSPKVKTYDLKPEMSAYEVTEKVIQAMYNDEFKLIILNFANPDMVGHTGIKKAILKAIEVTDECVKKIESVAIECDVQMLITADHGNAEKMEENGQPHTAHTTEPVPFILINGPKNAQLKEGGTLADIAPTILELLGIDQPVEMTGKSLLK